MIKALYQAEFELECEDIRIFTQLCDEFYEDFDFTRNMTKYVILYGTFEDYNEATKAHYKLKELLKKYNEAGLIKYPLI